MLQRWGRGWASLETLQSGLCCRAGDGFERPGWCWGAAGLCKNETPLLPPDVRATSFIPSPLGDWCSKPEEPWILESWCSPSPPLPLLPHPVHPQVCRIASRVLCKPVCYSGSRLPKPRPAPLLCRRAPVLRCTWTWHFDLLKTLTLSGSSQTP